MPKNVLMILSDNSFPPDIRVEKEIKALLKNGHNITLFANKRPREKAIEKKDGVTITRKRFIFSNAIITYLYYFLFFRYIIFFWILLEIKKRGAAVLHVHDLPFFLASRLAGFCLGIPVIFDMHENYPTLIKNAAKNKNIFFKIANLLRFIIFSVEFKFAYKTATQILVVSLEEKNELIRKGVNYGKITVVSNTLDTDVMPQIAPERNLDEKRKQVNICYVGGLSFHRGLSQVVLALKKIPFELLRRIQLQIVGDGAEKEPLKKLIYKNGLSDYVFLMGQYNFKNAMKVVSKSDICLIPYIKNAQTDHAIPHKIFQYMYYKKPLLVSNVSSLSRIVLEANCGLIYKAGDVNDLAKKLMELIQSPEKRYQFGRNGNVSVLSNYNWSVDAQRLVNLYSNICT